MADFTIECSDEMMEKIEAIAFSETKIEVGGFLVGTYDENGAVVTDVLPARHSVGASTQLTFTHDTWNALYEDLNKIGGALVGWFHSHPNFGVFLSEHDKFIQQNFFGANGNITIVVDPIRGRRGWFYSQDNKIKVYQKEEDTTRARLGVSATNSDENIEAIMGISNNGGVTTGKVILISAIMSLLGTFLGYGLSVTTNANSDVANQVAVLQEKVFFLENPQLANQPTVVATKKAPAPSAPAKASAKPTAAATTKGAPATGKKASATPSKTPQILGAAPKDGGKCNPTVDKTPVGGLKCEKNTTGTAGTWKPVVTETKPDPAKNKATTDTSTVKTQ
jgi:proteasome lid subunit RPN8/RPN11